MISYVCRILGNYYSYEGEHPFNRLIYPLPMGGGLGIHYTKTMDDRGLFGPDVEWVEEIEYGIDKSSQEEFYKAIK